MICDVRIAEWIDIDEPERGNQRAAEEQRYGERRTRSATRCPPRDVSIVVPQHATMPGGVVREQCRDQQRDGLRPGTSESCKTPDHISTSLSDVLRASECSQNNCGANSIR
jgi:hypothetical protein